MDSIDSKEANMAAIIAPTKEDNNQASLKGLEQSGKKVEASTLNGQKEERDLLKDRVNKEHQIYMQEKRVGSGKEHGAARRFLERVGKVLKNEATARIVSVALQGSDDLAILGKDIQQATSPKGQGTEQAKGDEQTIFIPNAEPYELGANTPRRQAAGVGPAGLNQRVEYRESVKNGVKTTDIVIPRRSEPK